MTRLIFAGLALLMSCTFAFGQDAPMQAILQGQSELIVKSSRKIIEPAIASITNSGLPQAQDVLQAWQGKTMWQRKSDGLFFRGEKLETKTYRLFDFDTGEAVGDAPKSDLKQIKPNSGIRALIGSALVQFQLSDPDPMRRLAALTSIQRDPSADLIAPLRGSIDAETDAVVLAKKHRAERLLTIAYDQSRMEGPPFSVTDDNARTLLGKDFDIAELAHYSGPERLGNLANRGLETLDERVYLLTRNR